GVADQVQPHVVEVLHLLERVAQLVDVARRDLRDAGLEADRRHDVLELHRLRLLRDDLLLLDAVAGAALEQGRILRPAPERLVVPELTLDRAARRRADRGRTGVDRRQQRFERLPGALLRTLPVALRRAAPAPGDVRL